MKLADGSLVLAIETSNPSSWTPASPVKPGVALGRVRSGGAEVGGVEVIGVESCDPTSRDDELMIAIDRVFAGAGGSPRELAAVVVSSGPGGFTAVRIAATVAKMLADAAGTSVGGCRLIAAPTACVAALSAGPGHGPFAVVLASKGEDAYVTRFGSAADAVRGELGSIMSAADLGTLGVTRLIADGFLPASMRAWAEAAGVPVEPLVLDPRRCLELVTLPAVDPLAYGPVYPRIPEAVRKWRELHAKK